MSEYEGYGAPRPSSIPEQELCVSPEQISGLTVSSRVRVVLTGRVTGIEEEEDAAPPNSVTELGRRRYKITVESEDVQVEPMSVSQLAERLMQPHLLPTNPGGPVTPYPG